MRTLLLIAALGLAFLARAAGAQTLEPGIIRISVLSAQSGRAVPDATVRLNLAGGTSSGFTDAEGNVVFRDAIPQIYSIEVRAKGYAASARVEFEVLSGRDVAITVKLVPQLQTIGSTQARPAVDVRSVELSADSPERRISASLLDALAKVSGVAIVDSPYGTAFGNSISLNGQDPTATGYSVNGATLNGPSNVNIAQDLFTGASVAFAPTLGYLGGMIDYRSLRPTQTAQLAGSLAVGSYGSSSSGASFTGSAGRLGIALQHTLRGVDSFLAGNDFADQSGRTSYHSGGIYRAADSLGLRYAPGRRLTLDLTELRAVERSEIECARYLAALPCGIGPGNTTGASYRSHILEAVSWVGASQLALTLTRSVSTNALDESKRYLFGAPAPYASDSISRTRGMSLTYLGAAGKHNLRVDERLFATDAAYRSLPASVFAYSDRSLGTSVQDQYRLNRQLMLTAHVDAATSVHAGATTQLGTDARWTPTRADTVDVGFISGRSQSPLGAVRTLADSGSAIFDCFNGTSLVNGPSDTPGRQSLSGLTAGWTHKAQAGYLHVQASDFRSAGGLREMLLPLGTDQFSDSTAMDAYVGQLQRLWSDPRGCGSAAFDPVRVYVDRYVVAPPQRSKNLGVSGRLSLGHNVIVLPSVSVNDVRFTSLGAPFQRAGNFYRAGVQLPNVAYYTGSLTLDANTRAGVEWLVNLQAVGANNASNLPGYLTLNLAANVKTRYGRVSAVVSNVQNAKSGLFTTYQDANARPLYGGGSIAFPTTPAAPRQWSVSFSPALGLKTPTRQTPAKRGTP